MIRAYSTVSYSNQGTVVKDQYTLGDVPVRVCPDLPFQVLILREYVIHRPEAPRATVEEAALAWLLERRGIAWDRPLIAAALRLMTKKIIRVS